MNPADITTQLVPFLLAQTPPPQQSLFASLIPFAAVIAIFYFILIRPARKRQKDLDNLITSLKPGDKVLTTGGIYGTVVGITDTRLQLRIADQVKIDIVKSAVAAKDEPSS